jgi:phosphopantetheinyl transferase
MQSVKVYWLNIRSVKEKESYLLSLLPEERVAKSRRFVHDSDRLLSLAAGYLAYRYVGDTYVDALGKPRADSVHFSLSHSGEVAALAVHGRQEVGLDIEADVADKSFAQLARYCLQSHEEAAFRMGQPFLSLFTAKESLAKADGRGLKADIRGIPALPLDGAVTYGGKHYFRHTFTLDGYHASVSVENEDFSIEMEEVYVY